MRTSLVLVAATLACSMDPLSTAEPRVPAVPDNPLISILATEPTTYVMTRLGQDESSPFRFNETLCLGLPTHTDVVDSVFFNGDGTYRRVYRSYSVIWRTEGVSEPEQMNTRYSFEQKGTVGGEGDVLTLRISHWRQNDLPFEPFQPPSGRKDLAFAITGARLTKPETLGTGCAGERTPAVAVFGRVVE